MKKIVAGLVALTVVGVIAWPKVAPLLTEEAAAPGASKPAPAVRTVRLAPQPFESTLTFNGTLVADKAIDLKSELRGKIERIAFTDGQLVEAGDLIVTIESGELVAELESVREQLSLAETNAERLQSLFERGSVTASERDDAVSQREVFRAEARRLAVRLKKTRINAPFAGTLGLRAVSPGDLIEADTLITTLQTVADLKVDFSVPERYRALLNPGTPVSLRVAGYDAPFSARVRAVSPRVDLATRTVTVRADVANPERKLLPGNYARVQLVSRNPEALLVPSIAVLQSLEAISVFTVENGVAVRREVKTGGRSAAQVEILQGLEPGDEVITAGIQGVRDGQTVNVRKIPDVS
ncbi:efflux RND transporter periplasmic adaptor subunit [Pseudohaliea rubra]|nr:efflux RND transporter periplasmic adaptor subunit [Pseudohaliea rubra]